MIINKIYETQSSAAVACFLPGRAKDLSVPLYLYRRIKISLSLAHDTAIWLTANGPSAVRQSPTVPFWKAPWRTQILITYLFISVHQTQLLLWLPENRVSVSYDYTFRSFFDNLQVYISHHLYILAVQRSIYLTNGIPLVLQFITWQCPLG
jgi:hypothetical protein